jgi:hypothetical protein
MSESIGNILLIIFAYCGKLYDIKDLLTLLLYSIDLSNLPERAVRILTTEKSDRSKNAATPRPAPCPDQNISLPRLSSSHLVNMSSKPVSEPERKVIHITGATGGIGKVTAIAFAETGLYTLALHYNSANEETCDKLAYDVQAASPGSTAEVLLIQADLGSYDDVWELHAFVVKARGNVDILLNNTGTVADNSGVEKMADVDIDVFETAWRVNTGSAILLTQLCLPHMETQGWGRAIFCSSVAGLTGDICSSLPLPFALCFLALSACDSAS